MQNKNDLRQWLKYIDPSLGVKLPERSYADSCDLSWSTIQVRESLSPPLFITKIILVAPAYQNQADIFVLAHILGWYAKAIVLRDYWFCWILSVMFEIMEYSLQHQLPNFAECWWDHVRGAAPTVTLQLRSIP